MRLQHCIGFLPWLMLVAFHLSRGVDHPEELVNLLAGTFTDGQQFSTGNTLPLVGMPWGFNHWSPQTREEGRAGSWWFNGNDHVITWLRCTHQPSPWIGDWGFFLFVATMSLNEDRNPVQFWEPRAAVIKPYLLDTIVAPWGIRMELAPTMHGAYLRVTYPHQDFGRDKRVCFREGRDWAHTADSWGNPIITGVNKRVSQDKLPINRFGLHIRIHSDQMADVRNDHDIVCLVFPKNSVTATVRLATSLISGEQAKVNLERELNPQSGFDDVAKSAKDSWHKLLKRVDIVDPGHDTGRTHNYLTIFYSGLARALAFPRRIDEIDSDGKVVHYSPYDPKGGIHEGISVTDNGFWDTFRTVYPMLSLLYPDHLGDIIQGWLSAYKEGGWLPSWASPGYRNCMVGTFADVVIADAIVKNIPGFDLNVAVDALMKDSFVEPPSLSGGAAGKDGLQRYIQYGYIPEDTPRAGESVSRTLDFGFADFSVAKAFYKLADSPEFSSRKTELMEKAVELEKRSMRAPQSMFDAKQGFMVPKNTKRMSSFSFNPITWGNGFTEGSSWHHSFPPYALDLLASLHGGRDKLIMKLHQMIHDPSSFNPGSYGQQIHEMTEFRAGAMGQYGHNNQPCHHILWLFAQLGERASTEKYVRQVQERAYGVDFFAGDEDNGEQGAWFVLSALGLFSTTPGTPDLVLGSPLFRHVVIDRNLQNKKPLHIVALGTNDQIFNVNTYLWNGVKYDNAKNLISELLLGEGGVLQFVMNGEKFDHPVTADELHEKMQDAGASNNGVSTKKLQDQIKVLESEVKLHRGREEELSHKIIVHEQADRVAELPCSLHRETHDLLHREGFRKPITSGKGEKRHGSDNDYYFTSNITIVMFAAVVTMLLFVIYAAAVHEGILLTDYFYRAFKTGTMLLQGYALEDLKGLMRRHFMPFKAGTHKV